MKRFYVLTSFRGYVLSWLTTLNLDRGNDGSFDIYYHNFPMGTCLKHFINTYHCVCWMKSTSIDGLDVPYIRPWCLYICKSLWLCASETGSLRTLDLHFLDIWYKRWCDYRGADNTCARDYRCKIILHWIFLIKTSINKTGGLFLEIIISTSGSALSCWK